MVRRDCFQAPFSHVPQFSVQAALASTDVEDPSEPYRYRLGFIGSTDSHRAGAGYRDRRAMSDVWGARDESFDFLANMVGKVGGTHSAV